MQTIKTTRTELQEPEDASLVFSPSVEPLNTMGLETDSKPVENSMFCSHYGSGYNLNESSASMSGRIFVLSFTGKPLTPCKPQKARKLIIGGVAKVVWNKFGMFGIQMLIQTREFVPKTVLGIDNGTKFEGYSLISGRENILNVMWILPEKKTIKTKMTERKNLRKSRRWRNCRRRGRKSHIKVGEGFIAPSQLVLVLSRLKAIGEFFKCYPINRVAIEDVKFNHRDYKWGKNFSTIETGKSKIKEFIINRIGKEGYLPFEGTETKKAREKIGLKKSGSKSAENFNSHCVDSFVIALEISGISQLNKGIRVVDDTYRPVRRKLHFIQPSKMSKRREYSTGSFRGVRKGTICELGQIVGGTGNNYRIRNRDNIRVKKTMSQINWMSHHFKIKRDIC